jgi:single-stranded DNA-binding protein
MNDTKTLRSLEMDKQMRTPQVTLFGNLGGNPEEKRLPGRTFSKEIYNPVADGVETIEYTTDSKNFLVYNIACSFKNRETGEVTTRWIRCVDWHHQGKLYRSGDRIRVTGYFKERTYHVDGQPKTIREFVVQTTKMEHLKVRSIAA